MSLPVFLFLRLADPSRRNETLEALPLAVAIFVVALMIFWTFNTPCGPTPAPVLPDDVRPAPVPVSILESE